MENFIDPWSASRRITFHLFPRHTFRMKQTRQCLDRLLKDQLRYALTYSFGFVLTNPFPKEKSLKKLLNNFFDLSFFSPFKQQRGAQLC